MVSGKLSPTHTILSGNISSSSQHSLKGIAAVGGGGSADHKILTNNDNYNQQSITATIKSQDTLAIKVNEE